MRPDAPVRDDALTSAQKLQVKIAGIPQNRPGLGAPYPRMVYRPGKNENHKLLGEPLLIAGKWACETAFVDSEEDEAEALADGWYLSPDPDAQKQQDEHRKAEQAKDEEIAALKAQLAQQAAKPAKTGS